VRVAEPEAPCPDGLVLHVGRNSRGFGRMQHCDVLQVEAFPQGGANVTLHMESRCANNAALVSVSARLETANSVIFDSIQENVELQERPDGFSHALGLTFQRRRS
jgi:hypothetical protein